ncbi:hypothetical protein VTI74DRAFT_8030 [Chaetomium olivicolor]
MARHGNRRYFYQAPAFRTLLDSAQTSWKPPAQKPLCQARGSGTYLNPGPAGVTLLSVDDSRFQSSNTSADRDQPLHAQLAHTSNPTCERAQADTHTMAGAGPHVRPFYRFAATGLGAAMWFWIFYRAKKDGTDRPRSRSLRFDNQQLT